MALVATVAAHEDSNVHDLHRLLGARPEVVAIAGPPTGSEARKQLELQLNSIHVYFSELEADIEVFEARITGNYPAITTTPLYDAGGLEAEPGFAMTYEDALAIGRRLQEMIPDERLADDDLNY